MRVYVGCGLRADRTMNFVSDHTHQGKSRRAVWCTTTTATVDIRRETDVSTLPFF